MKKNLVCSYLILKKLFILFLCIIQLYCYVIELNIDPERHTYDNIPYAELDDETYRKWKEEKKKSMKKNQKCPCD